MKSKLFSLAATLVKGRKYTMALVGAQFLYLGYKYLKNRDKKSSKNK